MMAKKAEVMGDKKTLQKIMQEKGHPKTYRKLGREVKPWHEDKWREARADIVYRGNLLKFS